MFRIDDNEVVDATMTGNAARFVNHSCDPNCSSRVITVDGLKKIMIMAECEIEPGEELTYDYKVCRCRPLSTPPSVRLAWWSCRSSPLPFVFPPSMAPTPPVVCPRGRIGENPVLLRGRQLSRDHELAGP